MSGLAVLQRRLRATVVGGAATAELLAPGRGNLPDRIGIYRNAYRARLIEALRSNYPVLHRVLGDEAFADLAAAYVDACPSRQPSIRWFGDGLEGFLRDARDWLPHPALLDLVRMEWALGLAFDAADDAVLGVDALAALRPEAWPALCFRLHPSVRLLQLSWRVEPVWKALSPDTAADDATSVAPEEDCHTLLVWRRGLGPHFRSLPTVEAAGLDSLAGGGSFAEICAAVQSGDEAADAMRAAGLLRLWLGEGLIGAVESGPA